MNSTSPKRMSLKFLALALTLQMSLTSVAFAKTPAPHSESFTSETSSQPVAQPDPDQFKADLKKHLEEMDETADIVLESEFGKDLLESAGLDPKATIKGALDQLPNLTEDDLKRLQEAFEKHNPKWKEAGGKTKGLFNEEIRNRLKGLPKKPKRQKNKEQASFKTSVMDNQMTALLLRKDPRVKFSLDKYSQKLSAFAKSYATLTFMPAVDPQTCDPGPGTPMGITDVYIAKGVALAAAAVMEGFPSDGLTIAARLAPVAAWAAAEAAVLVLEGLNAVEAECEDAKFQDNTINKLNALQITADSIIVNDNANKTAIINNDDSNKTEIINNDNQNKTTIVNKVDESTTTITTAITAGKTEIIANADANTVTIVTNDNANKVAIINNDNANKEELKALLLRTKIEADLAQVEGATPVALFETPNANGGYLNLVRTIVVETINNIKNAGGSVGNAQSFLAAADAYKSAGNFKAAYDNYRKAYKAAAK